MIDIQKVIMLAFKPVFVKSIKKKIVSGELTSPVNLQEVVDSVSDTIRFNPAAWAIAFLLNIRPDDYRGVLRKILTKYGLEVKE